MKTIKKIVLTTVLAFMLAGCSGGSTPEPTPTPTECVHVDKDKNHVCDLCQKKMSDHADNDNDHACDLCGTVLSQHGDSNKDHNCDVCGKTLTQCNDTNSDHKCDLCGKALTECADNNKDHNCDLCGKTLSECADNNKDHNCDICGKTLTECADNNKDHNCDICGKTLTECADSNKDHNCDLCGKTISNCLDANNDHNCDYCGQIVSSHVDLNPKDHNCDICGVKLSDCVDADYDYYCDQCGQEVTPTEEKEPRIVSSTTTPAFAYSKGTSLSLVGESKTLYSVKLTDINVGFEFYISTYAKKYQNWITTSTDSKDAYNTTCFSLNSGKAHFNVNGSFTVYFETGDTNPGISIVVDDVSTDYKFYESLGSKTDWHYLAFAYETGEHTRTTYELSNRTFSTDQWIQIKKGSTLKRFTFETNIASNKYTYYDDGSSNSVKILTKISDYCRVRLFVSTTDQSLTLSIRYEK